MLPLFFHQILLTLLVISVISYDIAYGETKYTIEANLGKLYGYTSYNISGIGYSEGYGYYTWASELQWPINSTLAGLNLVINVDNTFAVEVGARKNIYEDTGKMKMEDSDYLDSYLIIYSESDTEMDMLGLNVKGMFNVYRRQKDTLNIIGGFKYQDFYFEASNTVQEDIWGNFVAVNGLAGTYKVEYFVPFVGVGFSSRLEKRVAWDMAAQLGYVMVKDEDDHVLRKKKATGDSTGYSVGLSGGFMFNLNPRVFLKLNGEYTLIEADGKQTQTFYETTEEAPAGTTFKDINLEIESSQTMVNFGIGIKF